MLSPSSFLDLVSGRKRGLTPSFLRAVLGVAEIPYSYVVRRRNRRFDTGRTRIEQVSVPVVSVGNLTVGGTGKTPLVEWLAKWFLAQGVRVAVVSRGYGARRNTPNDEALELAQKLPDLPHVQDPNRVAGAHRAIEQYKCEVILLDDGFQHRRLHRDLDIVLLDGLEPFGYGHLLPRGLLREPRENLARAQFVCLSRADLLDEAARSSIREQVRKLAPEAAWVEFAHRPRALRSASGEVSSLDALAGSSVAAFCGIGNPSGFRQTLHRCGCNIVAWREYPDHFSYGPGEIEKLVAWASAGEAASIVCTHKDLVKIDRDQLGHKPLRALLVETAMLSGREGLEAALQSLLKQT